MPAKQMPVLVKHCALAIHESGYGSGTPVEKVQQALDIAIRRLIEYGFLWKNAGKVAPEKINLTAKGKKAEARHRRESDGKVKTDKWNALYKLIQEEAEEDDEEEEEEEERSSRGRSRSRKKRYQEEDEDEEEEEDDEDNDEEDEEEDEPPRKGRARKSRKRVEEEDEDEDEEDEKPDCFGVQFGSLEDCEDCDDDLYKECMMAHKENKKKKRRRGRS